MTTCQSLLAEYSALRDGDLPPERIAALEDHLAECPACAHYDRVLTHGTELLALVPEIAPSAEFSLRLRDRLDEVEAEMAWDRRTRASLAGTVTVAALVAAAVWGPLTHRDAPSLPSILAHPPRLEARFSDGVTLSSDAALRDRGLSAQLSDLGVPVVDTPYRDLVFRQSSLASTLASYAAEAAPRR
jgi:anti-sigma factor RsiW